MKKTGSHAALLNSPKGGLVDQNYGMRGASNMGNYLRANPAKYLPENIKKYQNYSSHHVTTKISFNYSIVVH